MELRMIDLSHLKQALKDYRDVVDTYPEVVTDRQEEELLIAEEILRENTDS